MPNEDVDAKENRALDKSLDTSDKEIYRTGYKKGRSAGYKQGFRKGAIYTIVVTALVTLGIKGATHLVGGVIDNFNNTNEYVESGYHAVIDSTHSATDPGTYWYDYKSIADNYDPQSMDLYSYIFGVYKKVGWDNESAINSMNQVMHYLCEKGLTDCDDFSSFCDKIGACKVTDGKKEIDLGAFQQRMAEYVKQYNDLSDMKSEVATKEDELSSSFGHSF